MRKLELTRHLIKREWTGSAVVEHLGVSIVRIKMSFYIAHRKVVNVQNLARLLLSEVRSGRPRVREKTLRHFTALRSVRFSNPHNAVGQVLHPCPVLGHVNVKIR